MKKLFLKYMMLPLAILGLFASCSKDNPFPGDETAQGYGTLSLKKLIVSLDNTETPVRATPDLSLVTVDIVRGEETVGSYAYADLPEVLPLPAGDYSVKAHFGENADAAWESPYYEGSREFSIRANEVSEVETVVCRLANVKVTVIFDKALKTVLSDAFVSVVCGEAGSLVFTQDETRSAHFRYVPGSSTLVASFNGNVDGAQIEGLLKQYSDVEPGKHYKITYAFHDERPGYTGNVSGRVSVDATIEVENLGFVIDAEDPDIIEDDSRPVEGPDEPTPPGPGPGPVDPPAADAPSITAGAGINLDGKNKVTEGMSCVLDIKSEAAGGIQTFDVTIASTSEAFLSAIKDLFGEECRINVAEPGDLEEMLRSLPLICGDQVKGHDAVKFDISTFMTMLAAPIFDGEHTFTLSVGDANGTTVKRLVLVSGN